MAVGSLAIRSFLVPSFSFPWGWKLAQSLFSVVFADTLHPEEDSIGGLWGLCLVLGRGQPCPVLSLPEDEDSVYQG